MAASFGGFRCRCQKCYSICSGGTSRCNREQPSGGLHPGAERLRDDKVQSRRWRLYRAFSFAMEINVTTADRCKRNNGTFRASLPTEEEAVKFAKDPATGATTETFHTFVQSVDFITCRSLSGSSRNLRRRICRSLRMRASRYREDYTNTSGAPFADLFSAKLSNS